MPEMVGVTSKGSEQTALKFWFLGRDVESDCIVFIFLLYTDLL